MPPLNFITSLRIKSKQSTSVAVEVKPAMGAQAGEYPINVRVNSSNANAEAKLMVVLTGTYGLEVGTPSGLLSLEARQGRPANMSFYVRNTGSAKNSDIKFMTFKPENWKVEFKPEKIDAIEPGDLKQVEVIITPYEKAKKHLKTSNFARRSELQRCGAGLASELLWW
jgi:uncharacterized membrane protein